MRRWTPLLLALLLVRCGGEEEGRSCRSDEDCGADATCEGVTYGCGGEAHSGTCRSLLREGDECASSELDCAEGLACHTAYEPPVCMPPSPPGGPCLHAGHCDQTIGEHGAVCDLDASPRACVPAHTIPAGGTCEFTRACAAPNLCVDLVCRGPGAEGQACARGGYPADERRACLEGLYCSSDGVCVRGIAEGEACWRYGPSCAEGLFCYSQEAVCHLPLAAGETCIDGDHCGAGLFCSSRAVCSAPLAEGEGCWRHDRCADGLFCYSRESVCHAPLAAGEPCEPQQDRCAEGLLCDGREEVCRAAG